MGLIAAILINVALAALGVLLRPKDKSKLEPGRPRAPELKEGEPLPVLFGTMRVPMRIVRELGYKTKAIKEKTSWLGITVAKQTVGYEYRGTWAALFCHGPIDRLS